MNICSPSLSQAFPLHPPLLSFQLTPSNPDPNTSLTPPGICDPLVLQPFLLSLMAPSSLLQFHCPLLELSLAYTLDFMASLISPALILKKTPALVKSQSPPPPCLHLHS